MPSQWDLLMVVLSGNLHVTELVLMMTFCTMSQRHLVDVDIGITAVELDNQDQYFVGLGGLPNADGVMEFDAAVMDGKTMSYGAVMAVR